MEKIAISDQFLMWTELLLLWSIVSYGITADPLPEDRNTGAFRWQTWRRFLALRIILAAIFSYLISHSIVMSGWLATLTAAQPAIRFRSQKKWTAEFEVSLTAVNLLFVFILIRQLDLQMRVLFTSPISRERLTALFIVSAILLFVVRGGTYIVRGFLRKTESLPRITNKSTAARSGQTSGVVPPTTTGTSTAPVASHSTKSAKEVEGDSLDLVEINRGRLIGNLERLLLTLVVVAGSYAALGFLVAAKGLVRSDELQDRDFAEYFLVGSLCSVLVALCGGLIVRYTLLALWPELLSLQMQGS